MYLRYDTDAGPSAQSNGSGRPDEGMNWKEHKTDIDLKAGLHRRPLFRNQHVPWACRSPKPARLITEVADTRTRVMPPLPSEYRKVRAHPEPYASHGASTSPLWGAAAGVRGPREAYDAGVC